jgi:two-component system, cell cycle response regulator
VYQNYKPALPRPCPICERGTIYPCHEERDPEVVGCCNNPDCGLRIYGRDQLTGLRSGAFVDNELPRILATAVDEGTNLAVGLLDIDHFKLVNDNPGMRVGDQVLVQLSLLVSEAAAPAGLAARFGGDEFLLVLTGDQIPERFEALRKRVESHPWERIAPGLKLTVSTGVARLRPGRQTRDALIGQANRFLYAAKIEGGNRVVVDPD